MDSKQSVHSSTSTHAHAAVTEEEVVDKSSAQSSSTAPSWAAREAAFSTKWPTEQDKPLELVVEGKIPPWISGAIVRNGPGIFAPEMKHLFDGYGFLVRFDFAEGKVSTLQRFIESAAFTGYKKTGNMQFAEFGTNLGLFKEVTNVVKGRLGLGQGFTDNSSVNTLPLPSGNSMAALTESVLGTFKVDLGSLATLQRVEYEDDGIAGDLTTAHPVVYQDGTVYNLFIDIGKGRCIAKIDPSTLQRTHIVDIPTDNPLSPSWVHDLPATENYIVVPDTPVVYDLKALVAGGGDYVCMKWAPQTQKTKFHIVSRHDGKLRTIDAPFDFMTFHYTNAFESQDGKEIYLDITAFKDPTMINLLKLDNLRNLEESVNEGPLMRITIPLEEGEPSLAPLLRTPIKEYGFVELSRVNPNYKFKDYQYAYSVTAKLPASYGNALSKMDVKAGVSQQWHESGCIPNEPLMIPRPGATDEDDGVVTSLVTGSDGQSFLLVLDAATFTEVGRAKLPYGVPYGFHSQFYPKSKH